MGSAVFVSTPLAAENVLAGENMPQKKGKGTQQIFRYSESKSLL